MPTYPLTATQGPSVPQYFTCAEGENLSLVVTLSPPASVAGWTTLFTLRDGASVVLTAVPAVTDAGNGVWTVSLQAPRLGGSADAKAYSWDLWRVDAGAETDLAHGGSTVLPRARA